MGSWAHGTVTDFYHPAQGDQCASTLPTQRQQFRAACSPDWQPHWYVISNTQTQPRRWEILFRGFSLNRSPGEICATGLTCLPRPPLLLLELVSCFRWKDQDPLGDCWARRVTPPEIEHRDHKSYRRSSWNSNNPTVTGAALSDKGSETSCRSKARCGRPSASTSRREKPGRGRKVDTWTYFLFLFLFSCSFSCPVPLRVHLFGQTQWEQQ